MPRETKILIVDDNPVTVALLKGLLEKEYTVDCAFNSRECQSKIPVFVPDIVLLDILITEMNGYDICKWIRQTRFPSRPVVIIISSQSSAKDKLLAYHVGADDYITKPFSDDEVTAKVRAYGRIKELDKRRKSSLELLIRISSGAYDCMRSIEDFAAVVLGNSALAESEKHYVEMIQQAGQAISNAMESDAYEQTGSNS